MNINQSLGYQMRLKHCHQCNIGDSSNDFSILQGLKGLVSCHQGQLYPLSFIRLYMAEPEAVSLMSAQTDQ